jgi:hypothetical protein
MYSPQRLEHGSDGNAALVSAAISWTGPDLPLTIALVSSANNGIRTHLMPIISTECRDATSSQQKLQLPHWVELLRRQSICFGYSPGPNIGRESKCPGERENDTWCHYH